MSYSYAQATKPYEPLASDAKTVSGALVIRANEMTEVMLQGNAEIGLAPDLRIIPEATRLIQAEGKKSVPSKRLDMQALLNVASIVVAEQEYMRGKPFRDEQLGDLMLAAMQELSQSKHQLQQGLRNTKRLVSKHQLER